MNRLLALAVLSLAAGCQGSPELHAHGSHSLVNGQMGVFFGVVLGLSLLVRYMSGGHE